MKTFYIVRNGAGLNTKYRAFEDDGTARWITDLNGAELFDDPVEAFSECNKVGKNKLASEVVRLKIEEEVVQMKIETVEP